MNAQITQDIGNGSPSDPKSNSPRWWKRSRLLNIWVDDLTMTQLLSELKEGIVFTLNPDHLFHLQKNRQFYEAYQQADFITSDSKYVYWGLKLIGRRIQEKVSGSDIVPSFCDFHALNLNIKVFYLGAAPGVAQKALERTNARVGREIVVKAHSPSMNFVNDDQEISNVIDIVNTSGANVLIVGLGAPKQEIWIVKHRLQMPNIKIYMGVGATIDYEADAVKRAPRWMTRNGIEWIYRITTEPNRYWRRYLRDLWYFWWLCTDLFRIYKNPWQHDR